MANKLKKMFHFYPQNFFCFNDSTDHLELGGNPSTTQESSKLDFL